MKLCPQCYIAREAVERLIKELEEELATCQREETRSVLFKALRTLDRAQEELKVIAP